MIINKNNISSDMYIHIASRIKSQRSTLKLNNDNSCSIVNQRKILASKLNCTEKKIKKFEEGTQQPTLYEMEYLAECFEIPVDFLYFGTLEEYIMLIFTSYTTNLNNKIELSLCLNEIKIKKIVHYFNLKLDEQSTQHKKITYPEYQEVIKYAASKDYLPVITPELNIKSIEFLYGDNLWGIFADQFCYRAPEIQNSKFKKNYIILKKIFHIIEPELPLNYFVYIILVSNKDKILYQNNANYIPFEEIVRQSSNLIKTVCSQIDDTEIKNLSEKDYINIISTLHSFNTLNPYYNISKKKTTYNGPQFLKELYNQNAS
ncbi:hypothetical protein [Vagococcus fluvialis]|uniref:hypothetical protein n=1 Tax=Vagococcus fluvialis TaxID=2738 RepID=UPI0020342D84|nr:hypothetical protein [Vagococcus fluvialis]MCM2138995.1 hypothetical protein [Vagococcus fluvialis]